MSIGKSWYRPVGVSFLYLLSSFSTLAALAAQTASAGTAAAARSTLGTSFVAVENLVVSSVLDYTQSTGNWVIYGEDHTGGLAVIASTLRIGEVLRGPDGVANTSDDVVPGTRLAQISGTPVDFNGLFEIGEIPTPLNVVYDTFVGLPTPPSISSLDFSEGSPNAESLEGRRVVLENVTFQSSGVFAGPTNYLVTDAFGTATVRVQTTFHPIVGTPIPSGPVSLTGIFSQFDTTDPRTGGYQFLLTSPDDIHAVPEPPAVALGLAVAALLTLRTRFAKVHTAEG